MLLKTCQFVNFVIVMTADGQSKNSFSEILYKIYYDILCICILCDMRRLPSYTVFNSFQFINRYFVIFVILTMMETMMMLRMLRMLRKDDNDFYS